MFALASTLFALSFLHPSYSRLFMAVIGPYKAEEEKGSGVSAFLKLIQEEGELKMAPHISYNVITLHRTSTRIIYQQ